MPPTIGCTVDRDTVLLDTVYDILSEMLNKVGGSRISWSDDLISTTTNKVLDAVSEWNGSG